MSALTLEERLSCVERELQVANQRISKLTKLVTQTHVPTAARKPEPTRHTYGKILFDGGSRGNPGLCGSGYLIYTCDAEWTVDSSVAIIQGSAIVSERETNNFAEYKALILALQKAKELRFTSLHVSGDSKLVISQLKGEWHCGDKLRPLYQEAALLLAGFNTCYLEHIPRAQNHAADRLANKAMDDHTA